MSKSLYGSEGKQIAGTHVLLKIDLPCSWELGAGRGRARAQPRGSVRGGRGGAARENGWFQGRGAGWWAKQRGQSNGGGASGDVAAKE